jgi:hypothetical protein
MAQLHTKLQRLLYKIYKLACAKILENKSIVSTLLFSVLCGHHVDPSIGFKVCDVTG